jgi:uncharacterized membrane protein YhaH (DUF805 family)
MENWKYLLFSFNGRIGRKSYWVGVLTVAIAFVVLTIMSMKMLGDWSFIVWFPTSLLVLFMIIAVMVKRLHDRNKSGLWCIAFYFVPHALEKFSDYQVEGSVLWWISLFGAFALGIWGLIEMGILRGTTDNNSYGSDPLAAPALIQEASQSS